MADGVRIDGLRMRKEHVTNPDRRDKISWIVENLGKFAVDSAVNDSGKAFSGESPFSLCMMYICELSEILIIGVKLPVVLVLLVYIIS